MAGQTIELQVNLWYALHTRSRHEKLVHELLSKKDIETFLPLRKIKRRWSDRIKEIAEPLFKGYIFIHAPLAKRLDILQTKGVVRYVGFGGVPAAVPETQLEAVRRFIEQDIAVDPFPYLKEGERVVVRSGPLQGVQGLLVCKKNKYRLVISLDLINQSASVEIDSALVEPLG
jgi:transcription antitermination factor NusG